MIETVSFEFLVPSWWEIKVTVSASLFVILSYWYFTYKVSRDGDGDRSLLDNSSGSTDAVAVKEKVTSNNSDFVFHFDLNFACLLDFLFLLMIEGQLQIYCPLFMPEFHAFFMIVLFDILGNIFLLPESTFL